MISQDLYNEIISLIPIVCVDVAIVYDNKVLLIKRRGEPAKGEWWLPGGRLYRGETLEDCASRKAKEETGLDCVVGPMIHYASTDFGTVHSVNFVYLLFTSDNNVKLDDTCEGYDWVNDNLEGVRPYVRVCLQNAFDYLQVDISAYEL